MVDKKLDERIAYLQTVDPLAGTSSDFIGILGHIQKGDEMRTLLAERGDTQFSSDLKDYIPIIEAYGFEKVLELPFIGKSPFAEEGDAQETYYIYAHRDGLLLCFDTYREKRVNSAKVHYCWEPTNKDYSFWILSNTQRLADSEVILGSHDAREALCFNMDRLRENGKFHSPWPGKMFLWLLHYMDTKEPGYNVDAIVAKRLEMLPDWVKEMIGN